MASRREKRDFGAPRETAADYYRLHTDAVDALVGADEGNSPPVPEEELRKYRSGPRLRFADWAKALSSLMARNTLYSQRRLSTSDADT